MNILTHKRKRNFMKMKPQQNLDSFDNFYYQEIASLTGSGGWSIDFENKKSYLDPAARTILSVPKGYKPSLYRLIKFYVEGENREKATEFFLSCADGVPFETVIKMQTFHEKQFWVKAMGRPNYNDDGEIIGIHGVFIDIDKEKRKELELENSFKTIEHQNKRLQNFAHIVSHNLRSHTSNLQLSLEIFGMTGETTLSEKKDFMSGLSDIATNLNETLTHLNELVTVNNANLDKRKIISFQDVYARVNHTLKNEIIAAKADIFVDFSEFPEVEYIESYLESILQNLLSNALKYKHPDRNSSIQICTYLDDDDKGCLLIKDNGQGLDLQVFGDRVFSMYQTFHNNSNATGVGLFMTRNQIESLGGTIEIESIPNKNATFTITF